MNEWILIVKVMRKRNFYDMPLLSRPSSLWAWVLFHFLLENSFQLCRPTLYFHLKLAIAERIISFVLAIFPNNKLNTCTLVLQSNFSYMRYPPRYPPTAYKPNKNKKICFIKIQQKTVPSSKCITVTDHAEFKLQWSFKISGFTKCCYI